MSPRPNLAQRAARWSAEHRSAAISGWLVLVLASVVVGSAVGTKHIAPADLGNGQSRQGDQILAGAGFDDRADEAVLVQARGRGPGLTAQDPAFQAAIRDVVARLRRFPTVIDVQSPLAPDNLGQVARDRR
ncbi:MAG: hypothetical protein QOH30_1594, partial [Baekduia sp.]|nr:hypothetical protein [Baekduia sp.]